MVVWRDPITDVSGTKCEKIADVNHNELLDLFLLSLYIAKTHQCTVPGDWRQSHTTISDYVRVGVANQN